ncbi:hypothetical protein KR018_010614 [Drosophila ironensis]|nr:hypothetical protein KR018_010614 [Drosophila ironensis]
MHKSAKFSCCLLGLILAFGVINAQPARSEKRLQKQQAAPYPSAEELKPEIPFEEGVPDETYGPPDQTYGPPDQTYGPPPTDAVEQLPSAEDPQNFTPDPDAEQIQPIQRAPARLTQQLRRRPQAQRLGFLPARPLQAFNSRSIPIALALRPLW